MYRTWSEENDLALWNSTQQYLHECAKPNSPYGLELFITPNCNQKCEYCYLVKHGEKLYPEKYRDQETILKNMDIFLNFLIENNTIPYKMDLFTGEIWETEFGFKVLQKLLGFIKRVPEKLNTLTIPSNFSFIMNEKARVVIEKFIESCKFYGTNVVFSCSYDGPIIENQNRPFVDTNLHTVEKNSQEYADILFDWCKKYNYGFHPMVNAYSIEQWPEQFKWWVDQTQKYDMRLYNYTMFLEVRNNEWTDDKIEGYLKYLDTAIDYTLEKVHNNDIQDYMFTVLDLQDEKLPFVDSKNYNGQAFARSCLNNGCSVDRMMCIRLGDLAWAPCHRTSYEKLLYGRFKVDNDAITGIQALNIPMFVAINALTYKGHMKCDICPIAPICIRGCYGAQLEDSKEIFYPCDTVCELFFAKWLFLKEKYGEIYFKNKAVQVRPEFELGYRNICSVIDNIPKEKKEKWMPVISKILFKN